MAIKIYTCTLDWLKFDAHHCQRVEKALKAEGIDYEPVRLPVSRRKRDRIQQISGQSHYPVIQFEDGSIYRDDSKAMAATIHAGELDSKRGLSPAADAPAP